MDKLLLTKKVLCFGFVFFLSFPLKTNPYFDGVGDQALMQLAYVGSEALEVLKKERLSDEDLKPYLAPNYIHKELKKSAGCISYRVHNKLVIAGTGSLVKVGESTLLLTNAHVFLDEKGNFKRGEYDFILGCGNMKDNFSKMYINLTLSTAYKAIGVFGDYGKSKDDHKDYAFISLKSIPKNAKALNLKAVETPNDFYGESYLSGLIKDLEDDHNQKTLSCNLGDIYSYGNSASQANLVSHNCPTTPGTSGSPLVARCENSYCLEALHNSTHRTNGERNGIKEALTFNRDFIEHIEKKVKVLEKCSHKKENIYIFHSCLDGNI